MVNVTREYGWESEEKSGAMVFLTNKIRIRLTDSEKRPVSNGRCRVADDQATIYTCDADGVVEIPFRDRSRTSLNLEWGCWDAASLEDGNGFPWSNTFTLPILSAEDDVCAKRLYHLGFLGDTLPDQVRAYQNYFGLPATGILGGICDKMMNWHDGGDMPFAGSGASTVGSGTSTAGTGTPTMGQAAGSPLTVADVSQEIKDYLKREAKFNVLDTLESLPARLLVFGETHYTQDPFKASLFSELVYRSSLKCPTETRFHATERVNNTPEFRKQISDVISALSNDQLDAAVARLDEKLKTFLPVLGAMRKFPNKMYGFLPCNNADVSNKHARNTALFESFCKAAEECPDVPPQSIRPDISRGNYLLGAFHAARKWYNNNSNKPETTCMQLKNKGWSVHAIRLAVNQSYRGEVNFQLLGSTVDTNVIEAIPIFEEIFNGRSFFADLSKPDSPFSQLVNSEYNLDDDKYYPGTVPYNQMFDALLYLGGTLSSERNPELRSDMVNVNQLVSQLYEELTKGGCDDDKVINLLRQAGSQMGELKLAYAQQHSNEPLGDALYDRLSEKRFKDALPLYYEVIPRKVNSTGVDNPEWVSRLYKAFNIGLFGGTDEDEVMTVLQEAYYCGSTGALEKLYNERYPNELKLEDELYDELSGDELKDALKLFYEGLANESNVESNPQSCRKVAVHGTLTPRTSVDVRTFFKNILVDWDNSEYKTKDGQTEDGKPAGPIRTDITKESWEKQVWDVLDFLYNDGPFETARAILDAIKSSGKMLTIHLDKLAFWDSCIPGWAGRNSSSSPVNGKMEYATRVGGTPEIGEPGSGKGGGSDSEITFSPHNWDPESSSASLAARDETLLHELVHSLRQMRGLEDQVVFTVPLESLRDTDPKGVPKVESNCNKDSDKDCNKDSDKNTNPFSQHYTNQEEFFAVVLTNIHRSEKGRAGVRRDYKYDSLPMSPPMSNAANFASVWKPQLHYLCKDMPDVCRRIAGAQGTFNPIFELYRLEDRYPPGAARNAPEDF